MRLRLKTGIYLSYDFRCIKSQKLIFVHWHVRVLRDRGGQGQLRVTAKHFKDRVGTVRVGLFDNSNHDCSVASFQNAKVILKDRDVMQVFDVEPF